MTAQLSQARLDAIANALAAMTATEMQPSFTPTFPTARFDAMMVQARAFDKNALRLDGISQDALAYLDCIDPALGFMISVGNAEGVRRRKDASESLFFVEQLAHIRAGLFEVLYPNLRAKDFIPLEPGIDPGKEYFEYRMTNYVGRAQLLKGYADDLPRAQVKGGADMQRILPMAEMYGYTLQEIRAAMSAQMPLDTRLALAARRGMAILVDEVLFFGHADLNANLQSATGKDAGMLNTGLQGIANLTGKYAPLSFTTPTGQQGSQLWRKKSPDEMVFDLHSLANNIMSASLGIHTPDSMLMGTKAYNKAATTRMGDGSNQTVLSFFLATNPYIKNVDWTYRLDPAASNNWSGTTGRIIAYERSPERVVGLLPVEFEQLPPQNVGFQTNTLCHGRIGGALPYFPKSISYMDGVTDTND